MNLLQSTNGPHQDQWFHFDVVDTTAPVFANLAARFLLNPTQNTSLSALLAMLTTGWLVDIKKTSETWAKKNYGFVSLRYGPGAMYFGNVNSSLDPSDTQSDPGVCIEISMRRLLNPKNGGNVEIIDKGGAITRFAAIDPNDSDRHINTNLLTLLARMGAWLRCRYGVPLQIQGPASAWPSWAETVDSTTTPPTFSSLSDAHVTAINTFYQSLPMGPDNFPELRARHVAPAGPSITSADSKDYSLGIPVSFIKRVYYFSRDHLHVSASGLIARCIAQNIELVRINAPAEQTVNGGSVPFFEIIRNTFKGACEQERKTMIKQAVDRHLLLARAKPKKKAADATTYDYTEKFENSVYSYNILSPVSHYWYAKAYFERFISDLRTMLERRPLIVDFGRRVNLSTQPAETIHTPILLFPRHRATNTLVDDSVMLAQKRVQRIAFAAARGGLQEDNPLLISLSGSNDAYLYGQGDAPRYAAAINVHLEDGLQMNQSGLSVLYVPSALQDDEGKFGPSYTKVLTFLLSDGNSPLFQPQPALAVGPPPAGLRPRYSNIYVLGFCATAGAVINFLVANQWARALVEKIIIVAPTHVAATAAIEGYDILKQYNDSAKMFIIDWSGSDPSHTDKGFRSLRRKFDKASHASVGEHKKARTTYFDFCGGAKFDIMRFCFGGAVQRNSTALADAKAALPLDSVAQKRGIKTALLWGPKGAKGNPLSTFTVSPSGPTTGGPPTAPGPQAEPDQDD